MPDFRSLSSSMREIDDSYAVYVGNLSESDFDQPVDFVFTNGTPARVRRGEIILQASFCRRTASRPTTTG
jgi:hypothetical protein